MGKEMRIDQSTGGTSPALLACYPSQHALQLWGASVTRKAPLGAPLGAPVDAEIMSDGKSTLRSISNRWPLGGAADLMVSPPGRYLKPPPDRRIHEILTGAGSGARRLGPFDRTVHQVRIIERNTEYHTQFVQPAMTTSSRTRHSIDELRATPGEVSAKDWAKFASRAELERASRFGIRLPPRPMTVASAQRSGASAIGPQRSAVAHGYGRPVAVHRANYAS